MSREFYLKKSKEIFKFKTFEAYRLLFAIISHLQPRNAVHK